MSRSLIISLAILMSALAAGTVDAHLSEAWTHAAEQCYTTPAFTNTSVIYGDQYGDVYALNRDTGATVWHHTCGNSVQSSPAVVDGVVFFGSYDFYVYALDASTGAVIWKTKTASYIQSSPAVVNGRVYIGSNDKNLYCLSQATGAIQWQVNLGYTVTSNPQVVDGVVYASAVDNAIKHTHYAATLVALDASNGNVKWTRQIDDRTASPAIANGVLYICTANKNLTLMAISAKTGAVIYTELIGDTGFYVLPVYHEGRLYLGASYLYALNASTGAGLWAVANANVQGPPHISNGVIYSGGMGGLSRFNAKTGAVIGTMYPINMGCFGPNVANDMVFTGGQEKFFGFTMI